MEALLLALCVANAAAAVAAAGTAAASLGVNYGRIADNLPPPEAVVRLLESTSITKVKLFDSDPAVLRAFAATSSRFQLTIGFPNELIPAAARPGRRGAAFASRWVNAAVAPYAPSLVRAVAVGNEVVTNATSCTAPLARQLLPAMRNLHAALVARGLDGTVKLSSPLPLGVLSTSYPPSSGAFHPLVATTVAAPLLDFVASTGSYLMLNAYPFFAYDANPSDIPLDYALFRPNAGVLDAATGLRYDNLLDAQLDAVGAAAAGLGHPDVPLVVSETGWPSAGASSAATPANAAAYNRGLLAWLSRGGGTPRRPTAAVDAFIFALFDENLKPGAITERHYGLFHPDQTRVYDCGIGGIGIRRSSSSKNSTHQHQQQQRHSSSKNKAWCVAKTGVSDVAVQSGLDYACGDGGGDCRAIQAGQPCFIPNTLLAHASYAFNSYYQAKASRGATCDFGGAATLTNADPSYSGCSFPLL